ncbi:MULTISPECIES: WD40 repeat domain-containing serine/threonine protein kinase [Streptomyces]|uniref:WD40 repeat domain-containing serine/threonine protein kinase n=1 Tax=Streptomyces ehimensis TaxID=68195 RepID=A0ABV9BAG3_9ACTN
MDALWPDDPRWVGPYRLEGRLGAGGMGQVFLGTSPGGRKVAVKLIRAELADTPQFRTRFRREVDAARQVGGFHTAQVVDADPDAASPWLVTAFIAGPTLQQVVAEGGPLDPDAVLRLGAGLAEGLTAIHRCGLVHRDLKPGNVILADDGPRIIDFGIARAVDASSLTATGTVIGTYAYMSPEQIRADRAGPPSDVFALGSVLAFAATGRSPFDAPTLLSVVQRILDDPPELGALDGELRRLLTACLAKDPADRPLVAELPARFAGGAGPGEAAARPERTVILTPAERTRAVPAPDPTRPLPAPPAAANPSAGAPPYPAAPPSAVPPAASPAPGAGEAGNATRKLSRRGFLVGGLGVAAVAASVGIPLYLNRGDDEPDAPGQATTRSPGADGTTFEGAVSVHAIAFTPDGRTLLASSGDGKIWHWDLSTKRGTTTRVSTAEFIQANEFSRDGKLLFKADKNKILAWDVATGRAVGTFTGPTDYRGQDGHISSMSQSADGRTLAASTPKGQYVWDVASGRGLAVHEDVKGGAAAFSPDGKLLAGGSPVQVRRMPDDQVLLTIDDSAGANKAVFSPDGQILAMTDTLTSIRLWNAASRQDIVTLKGHEDIIQTLAFHPAGRFLASADMKGKLVLWDTTSGTPSATYKASGWIQSLAFSPDGKTLAAGLFGGSSPSASDTVRLWPMS